LLVGRTVDSWEKLRRAMLTLYVFYFRGLDRDDLVNTAQTFLRWNLCPERHVVLDDSDIEFLRSYS
jgi:hypothetical protein